MNGSDHTEGSTTVVGFLTLLLSHIISGFKLLRAIKSHVTVCNGKFLSVVSWSSMLRCRKKG